MASTNIGAEFFVAEQRFKSAKTVQERIAALEQMISLAPKHKSSEKLLLNLKTRLAKLRGQQERLKAKKAARHSLHIKKEGCGQLVMLGFANSGKSAILRRLTNADVTSTEAPFENAAPVPGMAEHRGVQMQLVELPSVAEHVTPLASSFVLNADALLLVIDASWEPERQLALLCAELQKHGISLLKGRGHFVPNAVVFAKGDLAGEETKRRLLSLAPNAVLFSQRESPDALKKLMYDVLGVMRVYTKPARGEPDYARPMAMRRGSTVLDAAKAIHKDLYRNFEFARVWGSARFAGQRVSGGYVLKDGDTVEMHMRS